MKCEWNCRIEMWQEKNFSFDGWQEYSMMTSSNRNIYRVTGPLWGESTAYRWSTLTKASDAELWRFFLSVQQTVETPVIWDTLALIVTSLYCISYFSVLKKWFLTRIKVSIDLDFTYVDKVWLKTIRMTLQSNISTSLGLLAFNV